MRSLSFGLLFLAFLALVNPRPAAAQTFAVTSAGASAATVAPGHSVTLTASVQSSAVAANMLFDMEVYNAAGVKVAQQYYTGLSFSAGHAITESMSYAVPSNAEAGQYALKIGIFTANWASLAYWDNSATVFTVAAPAACGAHASGTTYTLTTGTATGTTAATATQCPYGGTQPTTTTTTQSYSCVNGTQTAQGSPVSTTTNTGNPTCNAPAACGTTPSGSTVTQQISQISGTAQATTTQCPYGGTQPTTTTVTQVQLCTNGTLTNQGSPVSTTVNTGDPTCNAAAACGNHASGSTYTLTTGTTSGTTAATATQCPNGGTQPTTTTTTQNYICVNGTQTAQGSPVSTTVDTGNPNCNASNQSFGIKVSGNKFVSTKDGSVIQLLGVDVSGLEQGNTAFNSFGNGYNNATNPGFSSMASWNVNLVRIPLNEETWLGINNCITNGGTTATLQSNLKQAVANANAAGLYVILDVHWSAPQSVGCPHGQGAMPDADHAVDFWTSIANTFKDNPAVMFELFNEPLGTNVYANWVAPIDSAAPSGQSASDLSILLNGGTYYDGFMYQCNVAACTLNNGQLYTAPNTAPFQAAGLQSIVNAIRATGATNVIISNAMGWAGEIQTWLGAQPVDPLGQLAAGWHEDGGGQSTAASAQAVLDAGYPIVITEAYNNGANATGYLDATGVNLFDWAVSNKVGYSYWAWVDWSGGILVDTQKYAPNALGNSLKSSYCSQPIVNSAAQCN